MDLFDSGEEKTVTAGYKPLAFRMRPRNLQEFVGQEQAVGEHGYLKNFLDQGKIPSIIFWGPPGTGKTTLAMIIAGYINADFIPISAVTSGIKEVKEVVERAKLDRNRGRKTILFIDEIHRFNKSQQDAFLPHVENGTIILIGATTENPSFEVNSALLSRTRVITLKPLGAEDIKKIIIQAVTDPERGLGKKKITIAEESFGVFDLLSNGDARIALNILEMIDNVKASDEYDITPEDISSVMEKNTHFYDKSGEEHYNIISALHKSLRDSDPDAGAYWCARMLASGEEPLYVIRRMIRFASEDIGNADPHALLVAMAARDSYDFLGSPEGELAIVQAAIYLATAPKSNAVYMAYNNIQADLKQFKDEPVPMHLRNAPTGLMKDMGYGKGYKYAHDYEGNFVEQDHMPDRLKGKRYYFPTENGLESEIKERLKKWKKE
jgi:putative ATPase